jgi:hypothetical protein
LAPLLTLTGACLKCSMHPSAKANMKPSSSSWQ